MSGSKKARKRDNQSATTFWMDNEIKERAQDLAHNMKITMTDLLNRAVSFYLAKGVELDGKMDIPMDQLLTTASINLELRETRAVLERVKAIEEKISSEVNNRIEDKIIDERRSNEREFGAIMELYRKMQDGLERMREELVEFRNERDNTLDEINKTINASIRTLVIPAVEELSEATRRIDALLPSEEIMSEDN